jgi:hypothetical protein
MKEQTFIVKVVDDELSAYLMTDRDQHMVLSALRNHESTLIECIKDPALNYSEFEQFSRALDQCSELIDRMEGKS